MNQRLSSDNKAHRSFLGLVLFASSVLAVCLLGIGLGFNSLLVSTNTAKDAIACCGTLFSRCLVSPSMARAVLPWIGMIILLIGVIKACWLVLRQVRGERLFLSQLPISPAYKHEKLLALEKRLSLEGKLCFLPGPDIHRAFTAGINSPRIYVTQGTCDQLSSDELEAVLLHENHHRQRHDPLRSLILLFVKELLFFVPVGSILISIFNEAREEAADDAALASHGHGLELASALCQLAQLQSGENLEATTVSAMGSGPIQNRIQRLLSDNAASNRKPHRLTLALSLLIVGLLIVTLYMPLLMTDSPFVFQGCNPELCRSMGCM